MYPEIILKERHSATIESGHPWIYSGNLQPVPGSIANGAIVAVKGVDGAVIATGTYSTKSIIAVRVLEHGPAIIDREWIGNRIKSADSRRRMMGLGSDDRTTGYRVVFGESDGLPGLVIDRYADVLAIQITTAGMDALTDVIVDSLVELFSPRALYERDDVAVRREEGLTLKAGPLYGDDPGLVEFGENGRKYLTDVGGGQKTGFYLDQRDLRQEISRLSSGRRALDLFCYTGAAGIAALAGGASSVHFVDASGSALDMCYRHAELNSLPIADVSTEESDVFQWLGSRSEPEYDLVMLDPPALIKSRKHVETGRKGYHFLNRAALRIIRDGGIFVTSSCSAFFMEIELAAMLRRAADQAGVRLHMLKTVRQAADHPQSLYFPEAFYLKSFICLVERK
jgi:23S rRNA (cytosine1962-C5)-methyltransferase